MKPKKQDETEITKNASESASDSNQKKKKKKSAIILGTVIPLVVTAGVGAFLGYYFGKQYLVKQVDYSNLSAEELEDDNTKIYKEFNALSNKEDAFSKYEPYEVINIALNNLSQVENLKIVNSGAANAAGVVQKINGVSIRNGDSYFNESISSSSLVKVAKRFYQSNNEVDVYDGDVSSDTTASYKESSKVSYTEADFENTWGKTVDRSNVYVVSSKTYKEGSISKDENNNYKVYVKLDPSLSVIRYVKQMKEMSSLKDYPSFSNVELTYTIDKDFTILESVANENYEVNKFGTHSTESSLTSTYYLNKNESIPSLDASCSYEG